MAAISQYYASVGIQIDKNSLQQVDAYLKSIQSKMNNFAKGGNQGQGLTLRINNFSIHRGNLRAAITQAVGTSPIRIPTATIQNVNVNRTSMMRSIRTALGTAGDGRAGGVRLDNFSVNSKALTAAINKALNVQGGTSRIRIGALLSQSSLSDMRNQIRQAINQLVVNPTINPRVRVSRVGGGTSQGGGSASSGHSRLTTRDPRSMNPWHNPMMIGGAAGAFMRYGMFSLPFVAGSFGLNALSQNMTRLEGQNIMLLTSSRDRGMARQQFGVVDSIGERLGLKTSDMLPFYAQMFAGARGTDLEAKLPTSFANFMDYAMAMGVNDQQLEGGIRAISQAIAKGAIYSEEWRQQLAEQGFPEAMNILADVAAGGDRDKLRKMMEQGQVDVYKYLPLVLDEMGRRAQIGMEDYFKSVLFQQRRVGRANEDFLRTFMDAGASEGMLAIYRAFAQSVEDSIPMAERLGDMFRRAGHIIAASIVIPQEFIDWMRGEEKEGNFMTALFGASDESVIVSSVRTLIDSLKGMFSEVSESSRMNFGNMRNDISDVVEIIGWLIRRFSDLVSISQGYATGGIEGGGYAIRRALAGSELKDQIDQQADYEEATTGVRVSEMERHRRLRAALKEWETANPFTPSESFLSSPVNPLDFFNPMRTFDLLREGKDSTMELLGISKKDSPTPSQTYSSPLPQLNPSFAASGGVQYDPLTSVLNSMQIVPDYGPFVTPLANQITPEVRITITGGITVNGELGTVIDETNVSESINDYINRMLLGARTGIPYVSR